MPRILVTYATRYGSTAQIATAIAEEITDAGLDVDVLVAGPQIQVEKYDAVVVGSPSYGRTWLAQAAYFVVGNADRLAEMPVALFTVGMLGVKNPKMALREHERIVEKLVGLVPGLSPVSTALFHGEFERRRLNFFLRILDRLAGTPQGDHRNWEAVRGWGERVADRFSDQLSTSSEDAQRSEQDDDSN